MAALGVPEIGSRTPLDAVADDLDRAGVTLLVLDNFEQLLPEAAEVVSRLSAACPRLTVLVTSRTVLHVYGEHEMTVGPLGVAGSRRRMPRRWPVRRRSRSSPSAPRRSSRAST